MASKEHTDLSTPEPESVAVTAAGVAPVTAAGAADPDIPPPPVVDTPTEPIGRLEIFWMLLAYFGSSLAFLVPLVYSLALRVTELDPGHQEVLGYITGTAQVVYLVASPMIGLWSDRTRSRLGRRRPFMIIGLAIGVVATFFIATAPTLLLVGVGWVVGMLGLGTMQQSVFNLQADRLPEEQRGKVSGLTGISGQIAPVLGISAVALVSGNTLLVFLIPALIGAALCIPFLILGRDADSRGLAPSTATVSVRQVVSSYVFDPRRYPDFGWNWLGRFVFFLGLYANTTFSTFFYSQRLGIPVAGLAAAVASIGLLGIVAGLVGGIGGGFLSDRLRRRKLFTLLGAVLFAAGAVIEAFAYTFPTLIAGALMMNLAIAVFTAVDQAIVMAVLPEREQAGRYMAVVAFAQKIPSGIAPLVAPLVISIGAVGAEKNYTVLYLAGGVLAVVGGLIIFSRVRSVR